MREYLRKCIFKLGKDIFTLTLFETNTERLEYVFKHNKKVIFQGRDFRPSPLYAIDSDETIKDLMGFLTLKPGDTDKEYFQDYTTEQMNFCEQFAEDLQMIIFDRYGEE